MLHFGRSRIDHHDSCLSVGQVWRASVILIGPGHLISAALRAPGRELVLIDKLSTGSECI